MGFFKKLGYAINKGFNKALPAVMAGVQVAGTVVGGPALGSAVASVGGSLAEAGGHPTLNSQNSGIFGFLGDLFGGGVSVQTPDVSIQTGMATQPNIIPMPGVSAGVNVSGGVSGVPVWAKWLGLGVLAFIVYRMFSKKRK